MSRKKGVPSTLKETSPAVSANKNARPRRQPRECLNTSVLEELWSIWRTDPRVPTLESRRLWANSRNANPRLVGGWFLRRKACAKKAGLSLPEGSYDLPLAPLIVPKREPSESELDAFTDLPSDDTLVYPLDSDDLHNEESSSDTFLDEDMLKELKGTKTTAYSDVPRLLYPEDHKWQPRFGSTDSPDAGKDRWDEDTPFFQPFIPVCNRAGGEKSDFTCILCSNQADQDDILPDFGATFNSTGNPSTLYSRLDHDFFPDTLSEPSRSYFAHPPPYFQSGEDWTVVEDELARLVNEGGLDFSFLDDPCLASMALPE